MIRTLPLLAVMCFQLRWVIGMESMDCSSLTIRDMPLLLAKGGCVDDTYSASFSSDVFSAEVGDWNGKYGLLEFNDSGYATANDSSYFEVTPADVVGMSVVFHCNDGSRAFCAPFVDSGVGTVYDIPKQDVSYSSVMAELVED